MTIVVVVVSGVCPFTASFTGAGDGCPGAEAYVLAGEGTLKHRFAVAFRWDREHTGNGLGTLEMARRGVSEHSPDRANRASRVETVLPRSCSR
ncbi:hypothetical protein [Pseudarthrobacter siccitolerans]